ncbi:hypothetical protein [uncultured Roseobacter sp.]|uniref:hypothetical protein n=1 Tax=uncultured Roseobacter sp. TaxID=114847 RepID=UPI0026275A5B|nr:hypothetical protein [uncultured Roseobacter sp.]
MFGREGFVSISRLWRDFENQFLSLVRKRALACMEADPHSSDYVFGTALDLCEDAFLKMFDTLQLSLVPLKGEIMQVEPVLAHSGARLLLKTTAFDSAQISMRPDEAGPDGMWLKQMGSSAFCAADMGWLWPDKKGRPAGEDLEKILFAEVFHTLPILFERPSFVIPMELPPWSNDLLEDSYVRNVWSETRGSSICLPEASVEKWEKLQTMENVEVALRVLTPGFRTDAVPENRPKGGRPDKKNDVLRAYQQLKLKDENLSRKEELRLIEDYLNYAVGLSTLNRVRRTLRSN